jgi:hypothetical protein
MAFNNFADKPIGFEVCRRRKATAAAVCILVVLAASAAEAQHHKGMMSKYKYNEHVFPILRDRCGRCHVEGGSAPMSLMTFEEAYPWAESIQDHLVGEQMPPWFADPSGPAVKGGRAITTKELDILLTWASGGTPESVESKAGSAAGAPSGRASSPPPFTPNLATWKLGPPDLAVRMEADHTLPDDIAEEIRELTLPTGLTTDKWVKAVDLLPGTPSMVRAAVISIENGLVLGAWVPGDDAVMAPPGARFRLPAGAKLHLHIHYKKPWREETKAKADRSTIGLYFSDPPVSRRALEALTFNAPEVPSDSTTPHTFGGSFKTAGRVVAVRPSFDRAYASVVIDGVLPTGRRVVLLRLRAPQPRWYRRYWLATPIELPSGTKVEVTATLPAPDDSAVGAVSWYPLQVALDYVPQ